MVDGRMRQSTSGFPLASFSVESEQLPDTRALLPVLHRKDFELAWSLFMENAVLKTELGVKVFDVPFYDAFPLKVFNRFLPKLHYLMAPDGHLEALYNPDYQPEGGIESAFASIQSLSPDGYKGGDWRA